MYQQQATLSGLQQHNSSVKRTLMQPCTSWECHSCSEINHMKRHLHISCPIFLFFFFYIKCLSIQGSKFTVQKEKLLSAVSLNFFLSCFELETKTINNQPSCFTRLHNTRQCITTEVGEEVQQLHFHCTVGSSRSRGGPGWILTGRGCGWPRASRTWPTCTWS